MWSGLHTGVVFFFPLFAGHSTHTPDELWEEVTCKTTISAENEVEAQKLANNYKVDRCIWSH